MENNNKPQEKSVPCEIHMRTQDATNLQMGVVVEGKMINNWEEADNQALYTLMSMAIALQNTLNAEYFRRFPEEKKNFERHMMLHNQISNMKGGDDEKAN